MKRPVCLALLAVLTFGGCGTGGKEVGPAGTDRVTPPSIARDAVGREDYVKRANAICVEAVEQIDALVGPVIVAYLTGLGDEPYTDQQLMGLYTELLPATASANDVFDHMFAELEALATPDVDRDAFDRHWDSLESRVGSESAKVIAAAGDPRAARVQWDRDGPPLLDLDERSRELGVGDCVFK